MVPLFEILRIALRALRANKLRSALTMLGIVIGVAAVIAMFAVGSGANRRIAEQISSIGSNLLIVIPGATTSSGRSFGAGSGPTLTLDDAWAIADECPSVAAVAPRVNGVAQVVYGNANWSTSVQGTSPAMIAIRNWEIEQGRNLSASDLRSAAKVCLLGQTVARQLFGSLDPIDQLIRINKVPMRVVGLLAAKGSSAYGSDQDDTVIVPVTTAQKRLFGGPFPDKVQTIMVQALSAEALASAEREVTALLAQRHRIRPGQENDFSIRNLSEIMEAARESTRVMSLLLASIASVSLLVGGIGIMNIMLVSVTERTREIGIRMALGARTADVLVQFLAEALIMSLLGGAMGIALGVGGAFLISRVAGWATLVSPFSVGLSFGFSAIIGVFFGFYPAWKASRLSPIEALRYE
jgi:putative ABC transport system permease protein